MTGEMKIHREVCLYYCQVFRERRTDRGHVTITRRHIGGFRLAF